MVPAASCSTCACPGSLGCNFSNASWKCDSSCLSSSFPVPHARGHAQGTWMHRRVARAVPGQQPGHVLREVDALYLVQSRARKPECTFWCHEMIEAANLDNEFSPLIKPAERGSPRFSKYDVATRRGPRTSKTWFRWARCSPTCMNSLRPITFIGARCRPTRMSRHPARRGSASSLACCGGSLFRRHRRIGPRIRIETQLPTCPHT
jgi:hypothetical protein